MKLKKEIGTVSLGLYKVTQFIKSNGANVQMHVVYHKQSKRGEIMSVLQNIGYNKINALRNSYVLIL